MRSICFGMMLLWVGNQDAASVQTNDPDQNSAVKGQTITTPSVASESSVASAPSVGTASNADLQRYQQLLGQLRANVKTAFEARLKFNIEGLEESYDWKDKWQENVDQTDDLLAEFRSTACRIYGSDLQQPESLDSMIGPITEAMYTSGQLQDVDIALEKMLTTTPDDDALKLKLGMVYLKTNRFEQSYHLIKNVAPEQFKDIDEGDRRLLLIVPQLIQTYQQEVEIRAVEKEADDLPRVELETTCGKIVVELFENEAPETVANFIALVESGHYENLVFHRVISSFMAQGGGFTENGSFQNIGYTINDEFNRDDFRRHFAGSLSMANTGKPNTGSAQFFINLVPNLFLDQRHTVFGTVIQGTEVYQRFSATHRLGDEGKEEPIDSAVPEMILSAKVIRKRNHPYEPAKATR